METLTEQSISPQAYFPATRPQIPQTPCLSLFVNIRSIYQSIFWAGGYILHTGGRCFSILFAATRSFYPGAIGSAHLRGAVAVNNKHPGNRNPRGMFLFQCKGITRKVI